MKKIISVLVTACIVLLTVSGCSNEPVFENKPTSFEGYTTDGKVTKMVADENLTGELNISIWAYALDESSSNNPYAVAARRFRELYPNVKLTMEFSQEDVTAYGEKQAAEIMSGGGSDLIITTYWKGDEYKTAMSGKFADMSGYMENDPNFNIDDFNKTVLKEGWIDGGQRLLPTCYLTSAYVTTKSCIEESGFDKTKCTDTMSTLQEIGRASAENNREYGTFLMDLYGIGSDWFNYENKTVDLSDPRMKSFFDLAKQYPGTKQTVTSDELQTKEGYFMGVSGLYSLQQCQYLTDPVFISVPKVDGGVEAQAYSTVAVNDNCSSKQAAWYFAKILLLQEWYDPDRESLGSNAFSPSPEIWPVGYPVYTKLCNWWIETVLTSFPEEFQTEVKEMLASVDSAVNLTCDPYKIMEESLNTYANGSVSYESLIAETENKIELAMNE